ncbi:MAG: acylphosphatase [Lentisphaeria bacterium]
MVYHAENSRGDTEKRALSAYHVLIHGEVTGVGFRFSAIREARRYEGLRGYIRNQDHATVECLVQGPEPAVSKFVDWLKTGPDSARVRDIDLREVSPRDDLSSFNVAP